MPSQRAAAACSTGTSPVFTADLQASAVAVSGRVLESATRAPVTGAAVSLGGQNTTTTGLGQFSFPSVTLSSGNTLTVSKSGHATYTGTAPAPAGVTTLTLPDVLLQPAPANSPVVTKVEPQLEGLFLDGVALNNQFSASVDWNGVAPGHVVIRVNDVQVADLTGTGPEYAVTLNMGNSPFRPAFDLSANKVTAQAFGSGGEASAPLPVYVGILPVPGPIKSLMAQSFPFTTYLDGHLGLDYDLPKPPWEANLTLPVLGRFGFEMAFNGSFDYTITDGDWEAAFGIGAEGKQGKRGRRPGIPALTRYPKMKLYVGNKEISGKIQAGARGTATIPKGITFDEVFGHGEIEAKLELGRVGLLDLVPGLSTAAAWVPGVSEATKGISIIIYVIPGVEGDVVFATKPEFKFDEFELTGKVGLEAAYEPRLTDNFELRVYVGGEPSVTFGYPGDLFRNIRFRAYAGAEFKAWVFKLGPVEYVFVDVSYPSAHAMPLGMRAASGVTGIAALRVVSAEPDSVEPVKRDYLKAGLEQFVAAQPGLMEASSASALTLEDFRRLGQKPVRGSVMAGAAGQDEPGGPAYGLDSFDLGDGTNQVDLTLVQNAFPASSPAIAARGTELMLLYVTDNGASNALQFTDIRWTRWDGTDWSVPASIETNTQAEFNPQVAYDGNGDAIAVWERVADPNFSQTNLTAMAAQMEIVWSKWSRSSGTWSTPAALTSNGYLDHAPLLCGPMTNGLVLATWTANTANLLMGTNGAGSQVLCSQWSPASQSWSVPQTLLADLPNRLSQSLAGVSNRAVYVWTRDLDGVLTNASDQQMFYSQWNGIGWGTATQATMDANGNRNARVAVAASGQTYLVWQQATNLVLSRNFGTNATSVRADSRTAGFADYAMTVGPAGNLVLLWQEMSDNGSDAHYAVYDPASDTWSKDELLCNDPPLEKSFAPVWDNVGNLTVAYNKVQMITTNLTVTLEGGGTVTITNVPQPGRVDLVVTKRALVKDLALLAGDFTVQGVNYLPGDPLTLAALVRNSGNVAVTNLAVAFYDGNPASGGTLITNVTMSGWLQAADTNLLTALWIVPEPATNHLLYAVVNPTGLGTEFDEANNTQSVRIGGPDLAVSLVSQTAETNGAVRVIARVQNLGAPDATNSVLAIRRKGQTNGALATVEVPLLGPGRLAQVALDLPPGTQPSGEALYRLFADDTRAVSDVDTNNNSTAFAVNLWIDSDGDGIPDDWMIQHFGHATGEAGDSSRAADDWDGDGATSLTEYLTGTDPKDATSYLQITSVAVGGSSGVQVVWGSATNKLYSVQRASAVGTGAVFTDLEQHILSTPPENTYLDATATNSAAFFYRIRVE